MSGELNSRLNPLYILEQGSESLHAIRNTLIFDDSSLYSTTQYRIYRDTCLTFDKSLAISITSTHARAFRLRIHGSAHAWPIPIPRNVYYFKLRIYLVPFNAHITRVRILLISLHISITFYTDLCLVHSADRCNKFVVKR